MKIIRKFAAFILKIKDIENAPMNFEWVNVIEKL